MIVDFFFPHIHATLHDSVFGIYAALAFLASFKVWLSIRVFLANGNEKQSYLDRWHVASEMAVNLPVLFGVLGTLIGLSEVIALKFVSSTQTSTAFLDGFSEGFSTAVVTTISGGLIHAFCFLLSSFDHWSAVRNFGNEKENKDKT